MNKLDVGLNMGNVHLPVVALRADGQKVADNSQINPSCIFNYLGLKEKPLKEKPIDSDSLSVLDS